MVKVIIRIDIDQIVEIGEHLSEVKVSMDKTIEEGCNMLIHIELTLGEKILEEYIEVITEMTTLEEVEVGLGKGNIWVILERMTEAVAVGFDQV